MTGWRPALRIARRSVRRSLGRSLLVAVLVALPVAAGTMVDVLVRTLTQHDRQAWHQLGPADAHVAVTAWTRLDRFAPSSSLDSGERSGKPTRNAADVDLSVLLPPGSRFVPEPTIAELKLVQGERAVRTTLTAADAREPLYGGALQVRSGRAATQPDEVLVSPPLARRMRLRAGMTITPATGSPLTVTGIARAPYCLSCERVFTLPGSPLARAAEAEVAAGSADGTGDRRYLVDLPAGVSADALWPRLAGHGIAMTPRDAFLHPERYQPPSGSGVTLSDLRGLAMGLLIVGLGLLEVVLLAGTAFAVGARRQTRELGLLGAAGGSAKHVRRVVLAQGVVLGGLGAAIGVAAGVVLTVALKPLWERFADAVITRWTFGPWEIAAAALIGVGAGLAAAIVPAIGAGRMRPVDALAGRVRGVRKSRRRGPTLAGALVLAGIGLGLAGDQLLRDDFAAYARALAGVRHTGELVSAPSPSGPVGLIVLGAGLLVAGLVILVPALIGRLAGLGARLPLSARLAVRDAARSRHRTGPATSAITIAVGGSVVLAFLLAGAFRADELRHLPSLPDHVLAVMPGEGDVTTAQRGAADAAAVLPGARLHQIDVPLRRLQKGEIAPPGIPRAEYRGMYPSPPPSQCRQGCVTSGMPLALATGRAADDDVAAGMTLTPAARDALAAGKVVVFDERMLDARGRVMVDETEHGSRYAPAYALQRDPVYAELPPGLVPRSLVQARGWDTAPSRVYITYAASATRDDVDTAIVAGERGGAAIAVERGPQTPGNALLVAIAGIAAFVTLVGVAISVALSAAEGRADLATLAAVGAPPARRRALAASQALLIAGLGCALGVAFGTFVAWVARATTGSPTFVIPWENLLVTGVAVPLAAVLVAGAFTPSRLPLVRRAG